MQTSNQTAKTADAGQNRAIQYVRDIPEDWQLVSDSQDIRATLESIGSLHMLPDVGCLFVKVGDAEYDAVYYCERSVPYNTNLVYPLLDNSNIGLAASLAQISANLS